MKRVLLYIVFLFGVGCKVTQPPGNRTEQHPEASLEVKPDRETFVVTDTIQAGERTKEVFEMLDSIQADESPEGILALSDSIQSPDSLRIDPVTGEMIPVDSLTLLSDSLLNDLLMTDTVPKKKGTLEATVEYTAKDSIIWTASNMAYLFGEGNVKYQSIELKSEFIQMDMDSSTLFATHGVDSLGKEFGRPEFKDGDQILEGREMNYNFKTTKATAKNVVTQQGEGYVIANIAKKMPNDILNMEGGRYTTCDLTEHPHFYLKMLKAKVRPGKDIVSGPVWLVIEDVPLFPIVLPFAFFPFTDTYSSGIIMPTYGDELNRGFFLRNGGYYLALSDYYDLAITGEVYTKGSWGITGQTSYRKRYKYSGNISASYLTTVTGDKGLDDYSKRKDFSIKISHTQDPKANPFQTISASVDYSSSSYDRNQLNSLYTPAATQNNKGSSVSYSRKFPNKPFNLSAAMNINQRSQDSTVNVTLPDMTFTMSRIYPLKRKNAIGKDRWYEKISINYNAQLRNSISTKEDLLFHSNLIKDWKNGMQHKSDINATYSFFDVINLSPNISYTERWYTSRVEKAYSLQQRQIVSDTIYGFNRVYNYSGSVSASTTLYGMFTPWKPFRKYVKMIRHRMDPSISFSATPDFGDPKYGFQKTYSLIDRTNQFLEGVPDTITSTYSPFTGQLFGVPGTGKSGSISFSVDNNIEAKIADKNETSGERKISLIDKLSGSISYNIAADTCKWSPLNTSLRLKLSKSYTLNLNATFDTYLYEYNEKTGGLYQINKTRFVGGKGLGRIGRLQSTGTSYSYTFNNDTFKKWFGGGEGDSDRSNRNRNATMDNDNMYEDEYDPDNPNEPSEMRIDRNNDPRGGRSGRNKQTTGDYDDDGYYNVTIPWSFSVNYNLSVGYDRQKVDSVKKEYAYQFVHALSFNGNIQPTKNWRITFNASYDFKNKKIPYATVNISRTMHCWQMSASVIPIGPMKSYSFSISANATMLKDLKYDQRSSPYSNQTWY